MVHNKQVKEIEKNELSIRLTKRDLRPSIQMTRQQNLCKSVTRYNKLCKNYCQYRRDVCHVHCATTSVFDERQRWVAFSTLFVVTIIVGLVASAYSGHEAVKVQSLETVGAALQAAINSLIIASGTYINSTIAYANSGKLELVGW